MTRIDTIKAQLDGWDSDSDKWRDISPEDIAYLLSVIEAQRRVVDDARREIENHREGVGHTCFLRMGDDIDALDRVEGRS